MVTKICKECGEEKSIDSFEPKGYTSVEKTCKACKLEKLKAKMSKPVKLGPPKPATTQGGRWVTYNQKHSIYYSPEERRQYYKRLYDELIDSRKKED
jgi:hypothetical protein